MVGLDCRLKAARTPGQLMARRVHRLARRFHLRLWREGHEIPVWRRRGPVVDGLSGRRGRTPPRAMTAHGMERVERENMAFARRSWKRIASAGILALSLTGVAACGSSSGSRTFQTQEEGGFNPFKLGKKSAPQAQGSQLGVNGYLWRASLDTLSFMPLASADPYGGLIITDWYSNPEKQDERFKATVYILDTRLRADGLNVALAKQTKGPDGQWRDAATSPQTETDIENAILTRARQL